MLRIYDKLKELTANKNKPHINEFHEINGLHRPNGVARAELVMKKEIIESMNIDWRKGFKDQMYLFSIFKKATERFQYVIPDNKRVTRCTPVELIDWSKIKHMDIEKSKRTKAPNERWLAQRAISKMLMDMQKPYLQEMAPEMMKVCVRMAEEHGLVEWMEKRVITLQK